MRFSAVVLVLACSGTVCLAQDTPTDANFLKLAHAKYDAPFIRGLQSFDCRVDFDWKQHFSEVVRLGDEGTDEEIATKIAPIQTRVKVSHEQASVYANLSQEEIAKLPHGGMAELLLEHAVQYSLNNWLLSANDAILPPSESPVHVEALASGYNVGLKIQNFDVEMIFSKDLRLQSEGVKGSAPDHQEMEFTSGPQGFLLHSFTQGENGNFAAGNHVILTYTYQAVSGFQLPQNVSIHRESHHEQWHYKLSGCKVTSN